MSKRLSLLAAMSLGLVLVGCDTPTQAPDAASIETTVALAPTVHEQADVMNQGGVGVYAADGAGLVRQTNGMRISMRVPTPPSGGYVYPPNPPGIVAGHPEVFTLWAFIFNFPELCVGPCDGNDLGDGAAAKGSVYNVGGHVGSGGFLNIAGRLGVGDAAVAPPGIVPTPLVNPAGAEVHVALTSHGALDSSTLPGEFRSPTGNPACGCWWVAVFLP